MEALDSRALSYACQRVEDFASVNQPRPLDEKLDATTLWLEYLGLDKENLEQLWYWLDEWHPDWDGGLFVGLAIGLYIHEYYRDVEPE